MATFKLFPVYENVLKKQSYSKEEGLSDTQKTNMITKIKSMNENDHEIIYMIIVIYWLDTQGLKKLPEDGNNKIYKSKYTKRNGIKFDVSDLPDELQHMMYYFLFNISV